MLEVEENWHGLCNSLGGFFVSGGGLHTFCFSLPPLLLSFLLLLPASLTPLVLVGEGWAALPLLLLLLLPCCRAFHCCS